MSHILFVCIPESLQPVDRGEKYEDPLIDALESSGLGEVTGGGTQLDFTKTPPPITGCYIQVNLTDLEKGLDVIRKTLKKQNAPADTIIADTFTGQPKIKYPLNP